MLVNFLASAQSMALSPVEQAEVRAALSAQMLHVSSASLALTSREKEEGRASLLTFMRAHPLRSSVGQRWGIRRLSFAALRSALAIALTGGTVAYAAEGSLPGDFLYPVKIHVTEPVIASLSLTDKSRAQWEVRTIDRRLTEAKTLQEQSSSPERHVILTEQMDRNVHDLQQYLNTLPEQDDRQDVRKELLSHLSEHEGTISALRSTFGLSDALRGLIREVAQEELGAPGEHRQVPLPSSGTAALLKQFQAERSRTESHEDSEWESSSSSLSSTYSLLPAFSSSVSHRQDRIEEGREKRSTDHRTRSLLRIVEPRSPLLFEDGDSSSSSEHSAYRSSASSDTSQEHSGERDD